MQNIKSKHLRDNTKQYDSRKTKRRPAIPPAEE